MGELGTPQGGGKDELEDVCPDSTGTELRSWNQKPTVLVCKSQGHPHLAWNKLGPGEDEVKSST